MTTRRRQAMIVGVGSSSVHRALGVDIRPLVADACLAALADAGVSPVQVDGIFQYPGDGSSPYAVAVQRMLGSPDLKAFGDIAGTGPSGLAAALAAVAAIESGQCDIALVVRAVDREWGQMSGVTVDPPAAGSLQFELPFGNAGGVIPSMGLRKHRRIAELGGTEEDYGAVAINARRWAALNPDAVLTAPLTMDDYLSSRWIAEPLRLLDCDYPVTGVNAAVLTTRERAADLASVPVAVDASAFGTGTGADWVFADDFLFGGTVSCARTLWSRSSVGCQDLDLVSLYDGFTHIAISWVEALGLCGIGEFGDWVDGGDRISPGGDMPLNTNGGQLAAGRLHGLSLLNEAVLQLRGVAGARQVQGAKVAAVANAHGPQAGAVVLIREG